MKGGHARSGPAPDPEALRRERADDPSWVVLPVTGRPGLAPNWPLSRALDVELEKRERYHWHRLWATPQAVMWEQLGLAVDVALYVRRLCEAEAPGASAAIANHVIRLSEGLGLTTMGLRANRWHIGTQVKPTAPESPPPKTAGPARSSSRDRLTVVRDDPA